MSEQKPQVLIVDDELPVLELIGYALQDLDIDIQKAGSREEGLPF